jgi:hypothetical protein
MRPRDLNNCNALNLHIHILRQRLDCNTTPRRLRLAKFLPLPTPELSYLHIRLVHRRKVIHISEENVHLHDRLNTRPRGLQHRAKVRNTLSLSSVPYQTSLNSMFLDPPRDDLPRLIRGDLSYVRTVRNAVPEQ